MIITKKSDILSRIEEGERLERKKIKESKQSVKMLYLISKNPSLDF